MSKVFKKLALGTIVAAVAGYFTGLLTAPKSGRDTREMIKQSASKALTEGEKKLKELHSELDKFLEKADKKLETVKGKSKTELASKVELAKKAKNKARTLLAALHEGDADDKELKKTLTEVKSAITHLKNYLKK